MSSCREMDNNRSALSAASAFAIATAGANEGTPTKEKYRRMSLVSTGIHSPSAPFSIWTKVSLHLLRLHAKCERSKFADSSKLVAPSQKQMKIPQSIFCRFPNRSEKWRQRICDQTSSDQQSPERPEALGVQALAGKSSPSST